MRREGDEDLREPEVSERVDEYGEHVHRDEDQCEEAEVAMELVRYNARPASRLPAVSQDEPR